MGMEKQGSKGGGFLQLFDWNRKSRKKLFSSNHEFPEGSKQGKRSSSNFPVLRPHLIDDDDNGRSSIKGSSDYSCSSSVTDEEGNGVKAPGVVARLMGLDSLPTSSVTESFSTPFFDSRSLRDAQYQRTHELLYERQFLHSGKQPANTRLEVYSRNNVDPKSQKLMNRPIERFQTEILPPKSAKSISFTHNKLFSPIKSPGYIPTKNAAQIMEQAAKIIEPGPQIGGKGKMPLVGPSIPLKLRDLTEKMGAVQRSSKFLEVTEKPVDSKAIKHLKGQSLNKSWNGEEAPKFRSYPPEESNAAGLKVKGKSISLAVQAKVNVQKRGGLSSTSSLSLQGKKEHKDMKSNQPLRNQSNSQKIMQKKSSTPNASSVLRQNNQKQNSSINRDKLPSKPGLPNQQSRKTVSLEASVGQNKPLSKVVLNSKVGQRKNGFGTNDTEKAPPASVAKKYTRKKRVMEEDSYNERGGIGDTVLVNKDEKPVQPSVAIEGHSKWMDDNRRKGMDVVSFTFTSPMKKHVSGSQASSMRDEKHTNFGVGFGFEKSSADKNMTKLSSLGLNVIGGDALNILLEQKLRELMGGIDSSSSNSNKSMEVATSASIQADSVSDSLSSTAMNCDKNSQLRLQRNNHIYESNCFSTEADMLQGIEETDENSVDSGKVRKGFNCRDPSPVSILEPCLSNESCISTDSVDSNSVNDSLQCSSTQSQLVGDSSWSTRNQSVEADNELSDSASSTCTDNCNRECQKKFSLLDSRSRDKMELEYVREVISNADFLFKDFALGQSHEIVNPRLFDQLENQKSRRSYSEEDNGGCRLRRRLLFDCVGECLDLRCQSYTSGSYKKWVKGEAMMQRKGWLAEEIYKEISGLRSMGDWMLDDLVDKDMSTGHGKWLDFEKEEFEVGEEIGRKILSCLVDEVVGDILLS